MHKPVLIPSTGISRMLTTRKMELKGVALGVLVLLSLQIVAATPSSGLGSDQAPATTGVSEAFTHEDTDTILYSSDNYLKCTSDLHVTPTTTEEVSELIMLHSAKRSNINPVKIRATRRGFHSSAGFVCPGERDNSKKEYTNNDSESQKDDAGAPTSITMLMHRLNHVVEVDVERHRITVGAGMTQFDLAEAAEANGLSVRAGAFSIYGNLSVSGVILASAHGSGLGTINSLGSLVTKVKWVNGKGEILVSDSATEAGAKEVKALVGGLGLLGIVTEFTLQLEPPSRTVVETRNNLDDTHIVADVTNMLEEETPHVIVYWRPDFGTYRAIMWTQLLDGSVYNPGGGSSEEPAFRSNARSRYLHPLEDQTGSALNELMAAWEDDTAEESPIADQLNSGVCKAGEMMNSVPMFMDGEGTPIVEKATIPTNFAMLAVECSPKCVFEPRFMGNFIEDVEFTIKMSQLEDWVKDVKLIVKSELAEIQARLDSRYGKGKVTRCMAPGYFWLRFGPPSESLLSTSAGTENVVFVQWTSLHSVRVPSKPTKQSSIIETIEQLSLCKYKARPHWGKNHERTFRHPECHVRSNFPESNLAQFLEMQAKHDPRKIFEPELFSHILRRSGPDYSELCTLHSWCYCQEDAHCPHGHACQPSPVFPEYKICRFLNSSVSKKLHEEL